MKSVITVPARLIRSLVYQSLTVMFSILNMLLDHPERRRINLLRQYHQLMAEFVLCTPFLFAASDRILALFGRFAREWMVTVTRSF